MKILRIASAVFFTWSALVSCKKDKNSGAPPASGAVGYFKGTGTLSTSPGTTFQISLINRADGTATLFSNSDASVTDTSGYNKYEGVWNLNNQAYNGTFDRNVISATLDSYNNVLTGSYSNPIKATFKLTRQ